MSPFDEAARCDACGYDKIKVHFVGPITEDPCWYDRKYKPLGKWPEEPYLHRTCERCGNEWPEAPLTSGASS